YPCTRGNSRTCSVCGKKECASKGPKASPVWTDDPMPAEPRVKAPASKKRTGDSWPRNSCRGRSFPLSRLALFFFPQTINDAVFGADHEAVIGHGRRGGDRAPQIDLLHER